MQKYFLPIFLAGFTAFIILFGGIIGGASFSKIIQRILLFSTLMAFLGFVLIFIFERWGIDITNTEKNIGLNDNDGTLSEETKETEDNLEEREEKLEKEENEVKEDSKGSEDHFTYTVDDEEIEFKPLDETIIEKSNTNEMIINGEKFQYDPKKAAAAIRQLLSEDKENE